MTECGGNTCQVFIWPDIYNGMAFWKCNLIKRMMLDDITQFMECCEFLPASEH